MAVDAVIFDWGGTLTPWHVIDPDGPWSTVTADRRAAVRLRVAEDEVWRRSRDEHRSASLAEVLDLAGHTATEDDLARYHEWWDEHSLTDPQVGPMWQALRERGIRVGVLSNTIWPRARHEQIFARDGVLELIDGAVYSSEVPWTKPHPEAFRAALTAVDVADPNRAVFVGDRLFDDVWGAAQIGLRTVYVPHSVIPTEQIGHSEGEPDAVITQLSELVGVIDRWR
ncbi:MAG: HAD family hydrolase [bacterium]